MAYQSPAIGVAPGPGQIVRTILLLCALFSALAGYPTRAHAADTGIDPALDAALGQILDQTVGAHGVSGATLAVSIPGHGTWAGARGLANRDGDAALTSDALFGVASISKLFVATVALQLVQEGWLSLDQTVEHWLPGLVKRGDTIAVRHLLSHTSGVRDYLSEQFMEDVLADRDRAWAPRELVAAAGSQLAFTPGARGHWSYSNTNYVLLGLIIEQVTHNSLTRELHQRIIDPLGLSHTFVAPDDPIPGGLMHGYEGRRDETMGQHMSFAWGAGNIISSASDLARFAQALFGGALLRPETLAAMQIAVSVGKWGSADLVYGLGLMCSVLHATQPTPVCGHTGDLVGYRTALWYAPGSGLTVAVALNQTLANPNIVATKVLDVLHSRGFG